MKKFYSLVLMATMLLIGTNAWAANIRIERTGATEYASLNAAFAAAQNNDVIYLTDNVSESTNAWLGEVSATEGTSRSVTLDLKGYTYTNNRAYADDGDAISITRGKLTVKNGHMVAANARYLFRVYGTYEKIDAKNATPFAHLVIKEDAQLEGRVVVCVDVLRSELAGSAASKCWATYPCDYSCDFFKTMGSGGFGVANGVRVDVYGTIIGHHPTSNGETYGIKVNGCVRYGKEYLNNDGSLKGALYWPTRTVSQQTVHYEPKYANGAENGTYEVTTGDNAYSPYIYVASSASIKTIDKSSTKAAAIYSSGYGRFSIAGEVEGSTGVYVKSGELEIKDANVSSNYTGTYVASQATNGGVVSAGSGIVMESNKAYTGDMDVTISGDTKVTATSGYAVDEAVTNSTGTKVDAITITGGTFESVGNTAQPTPQGTIKVTETTAENQTTTITVVGGTVSGTGENNANIGNKTLEEYLSDSQATTHITYVDNGQGGTTMVISEGQAPTEVTDRVALENAYDAWVAAGSDPDDCPSVKLTADGDLGSLTKSIELKELEMNLMVDDDGNPATPKVPVAQKLTVPAGMTLTVGRVIMGSAAQIIVEAGAQFIVTGEQGIVAPVVDNIVLKASETNQAVFLFNPAVTSNRHPNATVQMYAKAHHATDGTWYSQHFGIPTFNTPSITWAPGSTYVYKFEESGWVNITALSQLEPFVGYRINNTSETAAGVYTFKGQLNGNTDAPLQFVKPYYNLVANSYAAPMALKAVFDDLQAQYGNAVELTAWIYKSAEDRHESITQASAGSDEDPTAIKTIAPMQGFILYCGASMPAVGTISYEESVWNNPNKTGVAIMAPARRGMDESVRATIVVSTEKSQDQVVLRENNEYSSAFDNGADAHKYMSDRVFDLYSENNGENYSDVATDNLLGTTLTLQAKNETAYTMSFRNVNNFNYVLRDNLSGAIIPVEEGTTYEFFMAEGTTASGRFEIIGRNEVPTAIDNVDASRSAKGIYTILGQYVGETSILNTLPAGIYVVDGQRIVK